MVILAITTHIVKLHAQGLYNGLLYLNVLLNKESDCMLLSWIYQKANADLF